MARFYDNLWDLIQKPYVMDLLIYIRDHPNSSKSEIIGVGNERTRYLRLVDLEEWKLIVVDPPSGQFNSCKVRLSEDGRIIAELMTKLREQIIRFGENLDDQVQS